MSVTSPVALLIDSDEQVRDLMRIKLEGAGIEVHAERAHGIAAQQAIQEMSPKLVIIAVERPIQRPMQVIDFARAMVPDAMIVAYSGTWSPMLERRLMQSGVNDFLHGRITREQLRAVGERAHLGRGFVERPDAEAEGTGRVVTVIGQKGGIGKTTTSTNLAAAIARHGSKSVLLIDLDTRFGDVAVMMDVRPDYSVSEVARDPDFLHRDVFRKALLRHESGAWLLPAPKDHRSWLNCSTEQLQTMIRFASGLFDLVILDTPGTFNDVIGASVEVADRVVVVTSTDLSSLKNTALLLEHLEAKGRVGDSVLVTLIHGHDVDGAPERADVEYAISHPVDHEVPFDRNVRKASQMGVPVVMYRPLTAAAMAFGQLAGRIGGFTYVPAESGDQLRNRFFRVFGSRKSAASTKREQGQLAV